MLDCTAPDKDSLNYHLFHKAKCPDDLRHIIIDISRAAKYISYAMQTTEAGLHGISSSSINSSGENQLALDVLSDDILRHHLCESELTRSYASEEQGEIIELKANAPYSVVFDPLDGSSLVNANLSIGTIVGIYEGDFMGKTPREQVASLYILYGPRTLLLYSTGDGVHQFLLNDVGEYVLLQEYIGIGDDAKNYSPGNLRAITENEKYKDVMMGWLNDELTLRYSGCMVADIHHIFAKGQGVFANVGGGEKYPNGKLRLVFECGPFAYLIEQAGGLTSNGENSVLDIKIEELHQRTPFIAGSSNEVKRVESLLK
ncbi:fructose-1,6-bisphosphatase [Candidatus Peregrinibacteria bacterium]|mgnify:FL=1|jgi:fructose-1,6-bisphosphatase I|nr:fructose-1,6-bisphosphatase [Candidatus Peregrinibacteria bacterium]MBT3598366.1 fructose-1,6-bisphosphatase [Candidatus Peregrinibacteria bacterium]MBT4367348.1 fructose-1,6-bisphosphatase [Candidatus Peregrinibacteria bacterium]MBT4585534.1 fructose-1,6-bisphosphatase [Candidatus Peregrinibacteria bacterium]MBT6731349.1 fructose-1,6-bisphosphatase [Candidatus Peregrinibacteria bacterium]